MLQDLDFGRLENEYRNLTAGAGDVILCFHEGQVLFHSRLVGSPGSIHATVRPAIRIKK